MMMQKCVKSAMGLRISIILSSYSHGVKIAINLRTVVAQTIPPPKIRNVVALKKRTFYFRGHSISMWTRKEVILTNHPFFKATTFLILGGGIVCATMVLKFIAMLTPCKYDGYSEFNYQFHTFCRHIRMVSGLQST